MIIPTLTMGALPDRHLQRKALRGQGRERATAWLSDHSDGVGRRSTIDVKKWFA